MGQNKFQEKEIDGELYIFTMLRPRVSISLLKRIIKLFGPTIGKTFPEAIKIKDILDANIHIGDALTEFSERLDDKEVQDMIDILFTQVQHKGEGILSNQLAFDNLFTGRIKHLFKVVLKAVEVQYADFLPEGEDPLKAIIEGSKKLKNQ